LPGGSILIPFYPASDLYRLVDDEGGLQLDFMPAIHGIRSFEGLRARASRVCFGGFSIWVADLKDSVKSKRALGRPKDLAVLEILEQTLDEKGKAKSGASAGVERRNPPRRP